MGEPLYVFKDPKVFEQRHREGTEADYAIEAREIKEFNDRKIPFKAWVAFQIDGTRDWLFLLTTGGDGLFPRIGENCRLRIMSGSGKTARSEWFRAERIENDCAMYGPEVEKMAAFSVTIRDHEVGLLKRPIMDEDDGHGGFDSGQPLRRKGMLIVCLEMPMSSRTMDAELNALRKLTTPGNHCTEDQRAAFKWLMDFKNPEFEMDLFEKLPWMAKPLHNAHRLPRQIIDLYKSFDEDQKTAYKEVLANMPCGIGIVPGCPGAGKTYWNMVVSAMAQSEEFRVRDDSGQVSTRCIKILYLLDINKPLDDICMKFKKSYEALGLKKTIVRVQTWMPASPKKDDDDSGVINLNRHWRFLTVARLKRRMSTFHRSDLPLSLDEAAWEFLQKHKTTKYSELYGSLEAMLGSRRRNNGSGSDGNQARKRYSVLVNELYLDLLENEIDVLFSTPVAASSGFDNLFKPDFVFFDESPHAKELSTMIAIANFHAVWFFTGDHRQTRPFLRSDELRDNKWARQLQTSTMERAVRAGVIPNQLLTNHRAYANLHELPSKLFYAGQMKTAGEATPSSSDHLRTSYLVPLLGPGKTVQTPRVLVNVMGASEVKIGTSFYNPTHLAFVCDLIGHLARDGDFKRVGKGDKRGSVLLVTPYKESVSQYRAQFAKMGLCQENGKEGKFMLCEVRSIETVQGCEADLVIVDFVRDRSTDFTNDANRLCVALSRAKQAEIIVMSPGFHKGANSYSTRNVIGAVVLDSIHSKQIAVVSKGKYPTYKKPVTTKAVLTPAERQAQNVAFISRNTNTGPPHPAPSSQWTPMLGIGENGQDDDGPKVGLDDPDLYGESKPTIPTPVAGMEALQVGDVDLKDAQNEKVRDENGEICWWW